MLKRVTFTLVILGFTFFPHAQTTFADIHLKELERKTKTTKGDQQLAYKFIYLLDLTVKESGKLNPTLKKLESKQDNQHQKMLELYRISCNQDLDQRKKDLERFLKENAGSKLWKTMASYRYAMCLDKMDSPEALSYLERNLESYKYYPAISIGQLYNKLGIRHYRTGNINQCLANFQKAADHTDSRDTVNRAGILMNIGVINYRNGNNEAAIRAYKKADQINGNMDKAVQGMIHENLALSYSNYGDSKKAIYYYDKAARIYLQIKDTNNYNKLIQNKCSEYVKNKDYEAAISSLKNTLSFFKRTKNSGAIASGYIHLAQIYAQMHDTASALTAVSTSMQYAKEENNFTYFNAAFTKAGLLQPKPALELLLELDRYMKEKGFSGENYTLYNSIGIRYLKLKNYQKAIQYFEQAIDAELKNTPPRHEYLVGTHQNLGVIYYDLKDYRQALSMYKKAEQYLDVAQENAQNKANRFLLYANVYGKLGQYKDAYLYLSDHKTIQDSLNNLTVNDKLLTLKQDFQTQQISDSLTLNKKELTLSNLKVKAEKATNQRNTIIIFSLIGVMVLIAGLVVLIARSNKQRKKANVLLMIKNEEIHRQQLALQIKNDEIIDSINYAKRLQNTILPPPAKISELYPNHFLLYKPKDIVAGDFYVCESLEMAGKKMSFLAVADCTGHGVPGALVSMVCSAAIKRSVVEFKITDPAKILDKSTELVIESFQTTNEKLKDGMDISLACFDYTEKQIRWAGANNPLWIIRGDELLEYKGDKQPVGLHESAKPFSSHEIEWHEGDRFYFVSDGFADQFGGQSGKKLKSKNFKEFLLATKDLKLSEQGDALNEFFNDWKQAFEQVDDVCVLGIQL
jgi:tetratricopeptide (TPR) repeat protein